MEKLLEISLDGAVRGRRIGFNAAKMRAARLVLETVADAGEALRVSKMIQALEDKT